jgi:hypothetical protein
VPVGSRFHLASLRVHVVSVPAEQVTREIVGIWGLVWSCERFLVLAKNSGCGCRLPLELVSWDVRHVHVVVAALDDAAGCLDDLKAGSWTKSKL